MTKTYGKMTYPGPIMPELLDCLAIGHETYPHSVCKEQGHPAYGWNNLVCFHCLEYWEWREPFLAYPVAQDLPESTPLLPLKEYAE